MDGFSVFVGAVAAVILWIVIFTTGSITDLNRQLDCDKYGQVMLDGKLYECHLIEPKK